jgi:adenylate cyclase
VVEDVTDREMIIESFSRYVSRDIAQRILQTGRPLRAEGQPRRAVLLAVGIPGLEGQQHALDPGEVVDLLDRYVRAICDAVAPHGGVIDGVEGDRVMVTFADREQDCVHPVEAALELQRVLGEIDEKRTGEGRTWPRAATGLHLGTVLWVNVGGSRRMLHTVLGPPTAVARALQEAAGPGEVLVSAELAAGLGGRLELEQAPPVAVAGQPGLLEAFRVRGSART